LNKPPQERVWGTAAVLALCVKQGANIIRVHDVAQMKQVLDMSQAVVAAPRI